MNKIAIFAAILVVGLVLVGCTSSSTSLPKDPVTMESYNWQSNSPFNGALLIINIKNNLAENSKEYLSGASIDNITDQNGNSLGSSYYLEPGVKQISLDNIADSIAHNLQNIKICYSITTLIYGINFDENRVTRCTSASIEPLKTTFTIDPETVMFNVNNLSESTDIAYIKIKNTGNIPLAISAKNISNYFVMDAQSSLTNEIELYASGSSHEINIEPGETKSIWVRGTYISARDDARCTAPSTLQTEYYFWSSNYYDVWNVPNAPSYQQPKKLTVITKCTEK